MGEREPSLLLLSLPPAAPDEREAMEGTAVEITSAFVTINGSEEGGEKGETPSDGGTHDNFTESKEDTVSPHWQCHLSLGMKGRAAAAVSVAASICGSTGLKGKEGFHSRMYKASN